MADFITGETECPMTGQSCPAREKLIAMYREPQSAESDDLAVDPDNENHPRFDERKLQAKLFENNVIAHAIACIGPQEAVCPVRVRMNESTVRTGLVGLFRRARRTVTQ